MKPSDWTAGSRQNIYVGVYGAGSSTCFPLQVLYDPNNPVSQTMFEKLRSPKTPKTLTSTQDLSRIDSSSL